MIRRIFFADFAAARAAFPLASPSRLGFGRTLARTWIWPGPCPRTCAGTCARASTSGRRSHAALSPSPPIRHTRRLVPRVFLDDQLVDLVSVARPEQMLTEGVVAKQARDARERFEVQAGRVLRRDEQKKQIRRFAVERVEIYSARSAPKDTDDLLDAADLAMGDRDAVADRGRTQSLALVQHGVELRQVDLAPLRHKAGRQLIENMRLVAPAETRQDHLGRQDFGNFHNFSGAPRDAPRPAS